MKSKENSKEQSIIQVLLQSATDYVIAINRNYQIIMANDLFKNKFNMKPNGFCYQIWKNKNEKCKNCISERSFEDGLGHWSIETMRMRDGRSAQMLVKSTPVKNENGEVLYILETATDISGKKQLKKELQNMSGALEEMVASRLKNLGKSEERYRTIFERSRDAIILTDFRGKIMDINPYGVELLGYTSKKDLLSIPSVVGIFDKQEFEKFSRTVSQDGFVTDYEARLIGKNNRVFYALITSSMIVNPVEKLTGYAMIIRDITKIKQAQQEIERRSVRLAALNAVSGTVSSSLDLDEILHNTIDKILEVLEHDSVRIYLYDEQADILRLAAHKGLSDQFIKKEHVQCRKAGNGLLGQTLRTGETRVEDNFFRSTDVPYVDSLIEESLHSTIYIPLISKGKTMGVICVSSHRALEAPPDYVEFLSAIGNQVGVAVDNANLYENIKRAYEELKEAHEQVIRTEKLASLGKLAATIAHEINNPLAAVLTYIRLMMKLVTQKRFGLKRLEDISRYLSTMETETARCGEIVKNLLAFSRQSKTVMEKNRIEDIIHRTLALISHDLEIRDIQVIQHIEPDLPSIICDFKQIQQALLNIISNAAESMQNGGSMTVSAGKSDSDKHWLEVVISDTGCGISEEDLEHIFEPFFTTKAEGKGVGLGLSVVYGIITRHNGVVEVQSELGKGSIFTVRLPVAE